MHGPTSPRKGRSLARVETSYGDACLCRCRSQSSALSWAHAVSHRPPESDASTVDTLAATCCDPVVRTGSGKGWAKGLSAGEDPRVARAAAAHRGLRYERRTPLTECKWFNGSVTTLPLCWSDAMAYIVGLTATDGCFVSSRPRIDFKSA